MAVVVWPIDDPDFCPNQMSLAIRSNVLIRHSTLSGEIQTAQIPGTRWVMNFTLPSNIHGDGVQNKVEGLIAKIEGQANRVVVPHLRRLAPLGTMRGSPTTTGGLRGARTLTINAATGATLLPGDMLGVTTSMGSQLIMVTSAVTTPGTGIITVSFAGPLRGAVAAGSGIVWNAPTATFVSTSVDIAVQYGVEMNPGVRVELMETFA
jgi:hypothetical protein